MPRLPLVATLIIICAIFAACADNTTYYSATDLKLIEEAQECVKVAKRQAHRGITNVDRYAEHKNECLLGLRTVAHAPTTEADLFNVTTSPIFRIRGASLAILVVAGIAAALLFMCFGSWFILAAMYVIMTAFGTRIGRFITFLIGGSLLAYTYYFPPLSVLETLVGLIGSVLIIGCLIGHEAMAEDAAGPATRVFNTLVTFLGGTATLLCNALLSQSYLIGVLAGVFCFGMMFALSHTIKHRADQPQDT